MEKVPCVSRDFLLSIFQYLLDAVIVGIIEFVLNGLDSSDSLEELVYDIIFCSSHYGGVCDKDTAEL